MRCSTSHGSGEALSALQRRYFAAAISRRERLSSCWATHSSSVCRDRVPRLTRVAKGRRQSAGTQAPRTIGGAPHTRQSHPARTRSAAVGTLGARRAGPAALASRSRHQWRCALGASPLASTPAMVLHQYNTQHLLLGAKAAPEFSLRRGGHWPLLTALGELHGRNLASAFMRSRVHNRTSDRGGKPIRLAWPWARPRSLRKDRGPSPKNSPPTNLVTTVTPKRKQCRNV